MSFLIYWIGPTTKYFTSVKKKIKKKKNEEGRDNIRQIKIGPNMTREMNASAIFSFFEFLFYIGVWWCVGFFFFFFGKHECHSHINKLIWFSYISRIT